MPAISPKRRNKRKTKTNVSTHKRPECVQWCILRKRGFEKQSEIIGDQFLDRTFLNFFVYVSRTRLVYLEPAKASIANAAKENGKMCVK